VFLLNIPELLDNGLLFPEGLTVDDRSKKDRPEGADDSTAATDASSRCTPRRSGWTVKVENMS
jgi:hypothetical protein